MTSSFTKKFSFLITINFAIVGNLQAEQNYNPMRQLFLKAEKQVWQPQSVQYKQLYEQLHFYPLQPYLDQKRLMTNMSLNRAGEIETFLTTYRNTPLDWPLRKKWLNYLAKRKRKALFLQFYKENSDAKLNCTKLQFQLDSGTNTKHVLSNVEPLWLVGKSQEKACDPVFKRWRAEGYLSNELIWKRLSLAADGGKHTLIPYLTNLLPKEDQTYGKLWHKVRRDPANIAKIKSFKNHNAKQQQITKYGLRRLVWRSPDLAIKTFERVEKDNGLSAHDIGELTAKFAVALASKNHKNALQWIEKVEDKHFSPNLIQWRLAQLLQAGDWTKTEMALKSLPVKYHNQPQWQYWFGRSLLENGKLEEGQQIFATLSKTRHYYGFLAATRLKLPASLQHIPLSYSAEQKTQLLEHPAAKRAFEFFYLGRFNSARKEWNYWLSQLSKEEKLIAASIAYDNEWFDRPIFTLAAQGYLDDVNLRFPLAHSESFDNFSKKANIDTSWAMAISRRESSFMSDAHSGAGAKGIMQIMPATAKQLAKRTVSTKYLYQADNNIKLGTQYLSQLLERYNGNHILATASYNAGPHRVKQWLKKLKDLPADIWIENIPFKETRDYVKSVMAYQLIYQQQIGVVQQSPIEAIIDTKITQ